MLTQREQQTLQFLQRYIAQYQHAPTISEIADALQVSSRSMIQRILDKLEQTRMIKRLSNARRNIQLLVFPEDSLPLIGRIAAGQPIEAIDDCEHIQIGQLLVGENRYLLEVKGDSMHGDNICNGDWIICERRQTAPEGAIVVALIDQQEATLKRISYNRVKNQITLIPSHPEYKPMVFTADRITIQGIFIGLIRLESTA